MNTMYCDPCKDDRECRKETRPTTVTVRGETITVDEPLLVCTICGATQPDLSEGIDSISLAFAEYDRRHPGVRVSLS